MWWKSFLVVVVLSGAFYACALGPRLSCERVASTSKWICDDPWKFRSDIWKSRTVDRNKINPKNFSWGLFNVRAFMIEDLRTNVLKIGMPVADVLELLGEPEFRVTSRSDVFSGATSPDEKIYIVHYSGHLWAGPPSFGSGGPDRVDYEGLLFLVLKIRDDRLAEIAFEKAHRILKDPPWFWSW